VFEKERSQPNEDYFMDIDEMSAFLATRSKNPQGRRFTTMQAALTWNVESEMEKLMQKVLASLTN